MTRKLSPEIAEIMVPILHPYQYKILYGGRGGMRSWSIARFLLVDGVASEQRILCTREVQKSIKDSVHQLLRDQISLLKLNGFYDVLDNEIRGINGTKFIFSGLSDQTTSSIKSYEGVTRTWCEEAETITKRSWDILTPTIFRRDDSQLLVSFNPQLETDVTYQNFVVNPPDDSIVIFSTYKDNPWFPKKLEAERLKCLRDDPEGYENIWEGKCKPAVEGAIYYKEIQSAIDQGRVCDVPYDPMLKVHVVFDLGKGDSLFVAMVQKHLSSIRVIDVIAGTHFNFNTLSDDLKSRKYNWGKVWLPLDGYVSTIQAPSSETTLKRLGWDVAESDEIVRLGVEEGIRHTRTKFHQFYFDKKRTEPLVESLKRYRRHINKATQSAGDPVHDDYSHGADCTRYICVNADKMTNVEETHRPLDLSAMYQPRDRIVGI